MTITTPQDAIKIMRYAANWLETHPDKHCRETLAKDDQGNEVSPLDGAATCFCALGRIVRETHELTGEYIRHSSFIRDHFDSVTSTRVSFANDSIGRLSVITLMRQLADKKEERLATASRPTGNIPT